MVKSNKVIGQEKKRQRSTEKEKRRNLDINRAFDCLQNQLPSCVPKGNRLPKIKTLRLALRYIEHLNSVLSGGLHDDFATVALREIQVRNSYSARIVELEEEENRSSSSTPPLSRSTSSDNVSIPSIDSSNGHQNFQNYMAYQPSAYLCHSYQTHQHHHQQQHVLSQHQAYWHQ